MCCWSRLLAQYLQRRWGHGDYLYLHIGWPGCNVQNTQSSLLPLPRRELSPWTTVCLEIIPGHLTKPALNLSKKVNLPWDPFLPGKWRGYAGHLGYTWNFHQVFKVSLTPVVEPEREGARSRLGPVEEGFVENIRVIQILLPWEVVGEKERTPHSSVIRWEKSWTWA